MLAAQRSPRETPAPQAAHHLVQFHADDASFLSSVSGFLNAGLSRGRPTMAVATANHLAGLRPLIADERALRDGRLVLIDAQELLDRLIIGSLPNTALFERHVASMVRGLDRPHLLGEMVDVLMTRGNSAAAIALENLWCDLAQTHEFTVLCTYSIANFDRDAHTEKFERICEFHDQVFPPGVDVEVEGYDPRLERIAWLEQRAHALESELVVRRELESALRQALDERRHVEQELRVSHAQLSRSLHFSDVFTGSLGHDLRNPLSAITTGASLLLRRSTDESSARSAKRILGSAQRMAQMIDQILDFTRIRLGRGLPLRPGPADLPAICTSVMDELDPSHERVGLSSRGELSGTWDHDRLRQVGFNLIGNALEHGHAGGPVSIDLDGDSPDAIVMSIHNEGRMAPGSLAHLFEPSENLDGRKLSRSSRLGLGLFISHQIAIAHGGAIEVTSDEERGTTLTIRLPRNSLANTAIEPDEQQDRHRRR